jgi:hypothetical protein
MPLSSQLIESESRHFCKHRAILPLRLPMRYNAPMPKATQQAQRLDTERKHAASPPARVVEQRYRLQPADLPTTGLQGAVTRITRQGVETVTPVLHLRGAPRPLLLDDENVRRMVAVAGSPLQGDWVGVTVLLRVDNCGRDPAIRIVRRTLHLQPQRCGCAHCPASGARRCSCWPW